MRFNDAATDGESESHSSFPGRFRAVELVEDADFIAQWNALPSIGYVDQNFPVTGRRRKLNHAAGWGILRP